MNTYNINDEEYKKNESYQEFMKNNPSQGYLKIRAYAASGAIPIEGLKVVVSTTIDNDKVIFFEGYTNESGVIEKITLPAPKLNVSNLTIPITTVYDVAATYVPDNLNLLYKVNMYENIYVVQNINIVPSSVGGL